MNELGTRVCLKSLLVTSCCLSPTPRKLNSCTRTFGLSHFSFVGLALSKVTLAPRSQVPDILLFGVQLLRFYIYFLLAFVFYEYILTIDLEVRNIWKRPYALPTVIFALNRYLCIMLSVFILRPTDTHIVCFHRTQYTLLKLIVFSYRSMPITFYLLPNL
jgi:hypothetical protein